MNDYPTEKLVSILKEEVQMLTDVELIKWIEQFGRWNVQELVVKSQDTSDVLAYLRAERSLELDKIISFVTSDSVSFEERKSSNLSLRRTELCA